MSDKLKFIETSKLPTDIGEFTVHAFTDDNESKDHLAICMGDLLTDEPVYQEFIRNVLQENLFLVWDVIVDSN